MKKKLLILIPLFFTMSYFSQLKNNNKTSIKKKTKLSTDLNLKSASPMALSGGIVCYGYLASATQTLDLKLNFTNFDQEYADSIAITFPAGITPISSPDLTFPTIDANGGYNYYNGVVGQTISWGQNNNDLYGGVYGHNLNFKVVVNIGALSGVKTASFHLSGDGYNQFNPTGDFDGTFSISPKLPVDLRVVDFFIPYESCLNGPTENIILYLRNDGYNSAAGTTNLSYSINANTPVNESTVTTIAPNDTLMYTFATPGNFSALGGYTVTASAANSLDGNTTNNVAQQTTISYPINNLPYQTSFEISPAQDLLNWFGEDDDSPYSWDTVSLSPHTGNKCMRMLETSATTCDDWLFSSCIPLQVGKMYNLKYWTRLSSGYVGSLGVFLLSGQNSYAVTQVLKSVSPLVDDDTWTKDSIPFIVSSTGVYHIGFEAVNNTTEVISLRLDDISISESNPVGIFGSVTLDDIFVYPNPATDFLNIYSPNSLLDLTIYNSVGQIISSEKTKQLGSNEISLASLSSGIYLIKLSNDRNVIYKKIIKK